MKQIFDNPQSVKAFYSISEESILSAVTLLWEYPCVLSYTCWALEFAEGAPSSSSFPGGGGVLNTRPRHQGWRLGGVLNSARRGLRTAEARENLGGEGGEKTTPEG